MPSQSSSPSHPSFETRHIGQYQIQGELGASNMAVVYRAFDSVVNRSVAVKVLRIPTPTAEGEIAEARIRFESEVKTLSSLSPHDNIPILYHFGEYGDLPYFAMELIPGESLNERISGGKTLYPDAAASIIRQIARALDHAHSKGIVHRDIKPGNVLLQPDGRVKVIDFGIARIASENMTATGVRLGTPAYMSPEQIRGETLAGFSDQFSLATLAYRVLTGRMPFEGQDDLVTSNILHSDPPPPSQLNPALPPGLDAILLRALNKTPGNRFRTCGAFATELNRNLVGGIGPEMADATRRTVRPGRKRIVTALVGAFMAALVALAAWRWPGGAVTLPMSTNATVKPNAPPPAALPVGKTVETTPAAVPARGNGPTADSVVNATPSKAPETHGTRSETEIVRAVRQPARFMPPPPRRIEPTALSQGKEVAIKADPPPAGTSSQNAAQDVPVPVIQIVSNNADPLANLANASGSGGGEREGYGLKKPDNVPEPRAATFSPRPPVPADVAPVAWTDAGTGLMWALRDNGSDLTWGQALSYCQAFSVRGIGGWRLPEIAELEKLYDPGQENHIKGKIRLTQWSVWSATSSFSSHSFRDGYLHGLSLGTYRPGTQTGVYFQFVAGKKDASSLDTSQNFRALCVRRGTTQ